MKRIIPVTMLAAFLTIAALGSATAQPSPPPPDDTSDGWTGPGGDSGHGPGGGHGGGSWRGQGGHMGPMMMGGSGMGRFMLGPEGRLLRGGGWLADQLKLTSPQRDQLRDIGDNLARQEIQLRANMQLARLDLAKLMRSDTPSRSAIDAKINSLTGIQASMMKAGVSAKFDIRKVLTPQQRKQLEELRPPRGPENGSAPRGRRGSQPKGT
jgi:Spy/CpxP family protein refolding chaperone